MIIVKNYEAKMVLEEELNRILTTIREYPDLISYPAGATDVYTMFKKIRDSIKVAKQ